MKLNVPYTDASLRLHGFVPDNGICLEKKQQQHEVSTCKLQTCLQNVRFLSYFEFSFQALTLVFIALSAQFGLQASSVQL